MRICARWIAFTCGLILAACSTKEPRACSAPRDYWQKPHNFAGLVPIMNEISLTRDGSIYWNGTRISRATFAKYLATSHGLNPEPNHFLQTEMDVSCSDVEAVRDLMDRALECRKAYSHCAEGILPVWEKWPMPPGSPPS